MRSSLVVVAALVGACRSEPSVARFAVRGSVSGLGGGTAILLVDAQPVATLHDGAFEVPAAVVDGSLYTLAIGGVSELHACMFGFGIATSGTVAHADVMVPITCTSSDTRLATLDTSVGPVLETDIPNARMFSTLPVAVTPIIGAGLGISITATTVDPHAQIFFEGTQVVAGVPSLEIGLGLGDNFPSVSILAESGIGVSLPIHVPGVNELRVAPDAATADQRFGATVASSTTTLVVGAPGDGDGAALVYTRLGARWQRQARLIPPAPCTACRFGAAVAIAQDGSRIVVGAPGEASGAGAAYVFAPSGTTWAQEARLVAASPQAAAALGTSVAVGETGTVVAAGAPGEASGAGAVFVFARAATVWTPAPTLVATQPHVGDGLGATVALSGTSIAAGAPGTSSGAGAVIIFVATGATYALEQVLVASNARAGARFGAAVALVADRVVVGSPDESSADPLPSSDTSLPGAGAAYVYERSAGTWSAIVYLKDAIPTAGARLGTALALDANGALAVGAPGETIAGMGGMIVGFTAPGWGAFLPRYITDPQAGQAVGASLAIVGNRVVSGAPGDSANAGAVYSF